MSLLLLTVLCLAGTQEPSGTERLRKAIDEAKQELAFEKERIAKEEVVLESDLARAKGHLAGLTDELVDRTGSLARKSLELDALRSEREKLRKIRASAVQTWTEIRRTAGDARQKLSDLIEALPPSEGRREQRRLLEEARAALDRPAGEPVDLGPLVTGCRSILDEARTSAVFTHPVRNATGAEEDARVLRAGMIFGAYQGKTSGRAGEVVSAPSGQGYRWIETLPEWSRLLLTKAFDDESGGALLLPLDVTQRLAPERREHGRGFYDVLKSGGPVMIPLLAVGLLALILTLERAITLTAKAGGSDREILDLVRQAEFDEALRLAEAGGSLRLRVLAAALRARGDRAAMEDAIRQAVLREMASLERFLPLLGVLAAIAPMLGLLGTVTGMITTFDVIRLFGSGDPGIMAGGISEALVATAAGLVIAIPILLVHSWLSGRVDRILAETQSSANGLLAEIAEPDGKEVARA